MAERQVLGRLREMAGVHERARPHPVAEAHDDVVFGENLEQVVVLGIEGGFSSPVAAIIATWNAPAPC